MSRSTFVEKPGWQRKLFAQPQAQAAAVAAGAQLAGAITANVPVVTGQLAEEWGSMSPRPALADGVAAAELPIGSHIWHIIEFGSVNNPPYAPIRRGVDDVGFDFDAKAGA